MARQIRSRTSLALILFSYLNPLLRRGIARTASEARAAGFDGMLVTDLPPEEAGDVRPVFHEAGLDTIFLVSPTSGAARMDRAARLSSGFLYVVTRPGTTGARRDLPAGLGGDSAQGPQGGRPAASGRRFRHRDASGGVEGRGPGGGCRRRFGPGSRGRAGRGGAGRGGRGACAALGWPRPARGGIRVRRHSKLQTRNSKLAAMRPEGQYLKALEPGRSLAGGPAGHPGRPGGAQVPRGPAGLWHRTPGLPGGRHFRSFRLFFGEILRTFRRIRRRIRRSGGLPTGIS